MTMFALIVEAAVLLVLLVSSVMSLFIDRKVASTSPRGIGEELRRSGRHVVTVAADGFTWNPSLPAGTDNRIYGPGTATYQSTADGNVQLDYVDSSGRTGTWTGPLPAEFAEPRRAPVSPYALTKPAVGAVAFVIGILIADGGTKHMLLVGLTWALAGWILAAVFVMTTSMVTRTRAFAAQRP
jgi:hypothetical protein